MSTVKTSPSVENIVAEIQQLSDEEQRTLAAAVLQDRLLESFVEELEDQLNYEKAVAEGSAEPFND
jgi:hypothetical protein